jgi:spoIIIJ-associated protein
MNNFEETQKNVETLLRKLLHEMGVSFESIDREDDGIGIVRLNIVSKSDGRLLIGPRGEHLQAINTLVKQMLREEAKEEALQCIIDANNYQKAHIEHLRNQTKIIAERVKLFKKEMSLPPMSAYERMIVHSAATTIDGVTTRSEGEGRERCVVVVPEA